ncbi:MAG: hypothetical protein EPN34_12890 [Burkholderiaceae bacterium]|jgi:hypothetical protein|nr:MAG: hypothetical protein EPN34_12890 [Burkholderiaceae bacterium]
MRNVSRLLLLPAALASAIVLAACAGNPAPVSAQQKAAQADPCHVTQWVARDLYGTWRIDFPDRHETGTLLLRQHPEYSASLRGELNYGGHASIASGDIQQGELDLDESRDRKNLYAMWTGNLVPSSCGNEIRGTWQKVVPQGDPVVQTAFILRRIGSGARAWSGKGQAPTGAATPAPAASGTR